MSEIMESSVFQTLLMIVIPGSYSRPTEVESPGVGPRKLFV